jgi:hypothetical protein
VDGEVVLAADDAAAVLAGGVVVDHGMVFEAPRLVPGETSMKQRHERDERGPAQRKKRGCPPLGACPARMAHRLPGEFPGPPVPVRRAAPGSVQVTDPARAHRAGHPGGLRAGVLETADYFASFPTPASCSERWNPYTPGRFLHLR